MARERHRWKYMESCGKTWDECVHCGLSRFVIEHPLPWACGETVRIIEWWRGSNLIDVGSRRMPHCTGEVRP